MSIFSELARVDSVPHAVLVLALVSAAGLTLGSLRVAGIRLGVAGVLFAGLAFGHFGVGISAPVLDFAREFGLVLFVYTIGMQVGPGFLAAFRREGLPLNGLAIGVVALGALLCVVMIVGSITAHTASASWTGAAPARCIGWVAS